MRSVAAGSHIEKVLYKNLPWSDYQESSDAFVERRTKTGVAIRYKQMYLFNQINLPTQICHINRTFLAVPVI